MKKPNFTDYNDFFDKVANFNVLADNKKSDHEIFEICLHEELNELKYAHEERYNFKEVVDATVDCIFLILGSIWLNNPDLQSLTKEIYEDHAHDMLVKVLNAKKYEAIYEKVVNLDKSTDSIRKYKYSLIQAFNAVYESNMTKIYVTEEEIRKELEFIKFESNIQLVRHNNTATLRRITDNKIQKGFKYEPPKIKKN